ncbi:MAG: IS256 family transposase [Polyangiaceae bacterium]|nr:IS256 family transposase [Polyangiaceae bacterium]
METQSTKKNSTPSKSNRELAAEKREFLDRLIAECAADGGDMFGPEGLFTQLKGAVMERLLEGELAAHLEEASGTGDSPNVRNGHSDKTVHTESGPVRIRVPRDRNGTFVPQVVKKHQRRVEGFDDKVLALYARGMTTRDIQAHLRELYGTDVSHELISKATDAVMPAFRDWQSRPLDAVYPVVYLDALFVSVRDGVQVQKRAFYVALGVTLNGTRDVLGIWAAETEGAKFWLNILTELKGRGVEDILFVCADGLSGLDKALEAAFPRAVLQTCIVHLIRNALRYVSWTDRKELATALRPMYTAENETQAKAELEAIEARYNSKYPGVARTFRNRWEHFVPFLAYPPELRRILYTTNAIESLNSQLRKPLRNRGPFPNDEAVFKLFFLAIRNAKTRWNADKSWYRTLAQLDIFFEGRLPV